MDIERIRKRLEGFAKERDWEQFHNPKNLTTALSVEASELLEIFQWSNDGGLSEIQNETTRKEIEEEIADVFNYIVRLADILDVDLEKASMLKIDENEKKYPINTFKGSSRKYNK
jgi:NTP pyrophosphatase (non-canonical NTP hydrolase)|tara:strand:+ start:106 stop:450 length:345 start_codon:yes stop_codon:yes gene_type:complete